MIRHSNPFSEHAAEYDRWFDSAEVRDIFTREIECLRSKETKKRDVK